MNNVETHNAVFSRHLFHPKLLDALEDMMETEDIILHDTKARVIPPKNGNLMHQNYPYLPLKNNTMVVVIFNLDDTSPANGAVCVHPGSHKLGPLPDKVLLSKNGFKHHYVDTDRFPIEKSTPICAKKGDITVFNYLLVHGCFLDHTDMFRRMFVLQARAADDEFIQEVPKTPCQNLCLRGSNQKKNTHVP